MQDFQHTWETAPAQELHKNNNPIIAQLSEDRLSASFIADGYHLSPDVLKAYLRAKCTERVILVTDATAGAAAPQGRYKLGNSELQRKMEPVILDPQTSRPVGSAVTLDQCVRNVINWYDMPLKEAVSWAAENPLKLLNSAKVKNSIISTGANRLVERRGRGVAGKSCSERKFFV